jgi:CheY-like chemotaxis protein
MEHAALLAPGATTVLVIDDDPAVHEVVQRTLGREGFSVLGATSGAEGIATARAIRPAVILLDVMMPGTGRLAGAARPQGRPLPLATPNAC